MPYDDLPLLPPPGDQESRVVLKATVAARAALASLDQAARLLPNPAVLLNAATLLEAQASAEIENIVTTADDLFRYAADDEAADHALKEALRYRAALYEGVAALVSRPLTFGVAERVCSRIKDVDMTIRRMPGTRIANPATRRVVYAPPEGYDTIRDKLTNWERSLHDESDGLDPLVRMAIAHYQFESISSRSRRSGRCRRTLPTADRGRCCLTQREMGNVTMNNSSLNNSSPKNSSLNNSSLNSSTEEERWRSQWQRCGCPWTTWTGRRASTPTRCGSR